MPINCLSRVNYTMNSQSENPAHATGLNYSTVSDSTPGRAQNVKNWRLFIARFQQQTDNCFLALQEKLQSPLQMTQPQVSWHIKKHTTGMAD